MNKKITEITDVVGHVYIIECDVTDKVYIGQCLSHIFINDVWKTHGIRKRFMYHCDKSGSKYSVLHTDIEKYGKDKFNIRILETVPGNRINELDVKEAEFIEMYNSVKKGYNTQKKSTSSTKSKRALYEHYKIGPDYTKEYEERKGRKMQYMAPALNKYPRDKIVGVSLVLIKHLQVPRDIRVLTDCGDLVYRKNFMSANILANIKKARKYAEQLDPNYFVPSTILAIENGGEVEEVYKYQDKLNIKLQETGLTTLSINRTFHKYTGGEVALILFYYKGKTTKRMMFGGKHTEIEKAIEEAQEFVKRLVKGYNCKFVIKDNTKNKK